MLFTNPTIFPRGFLARKESQFYEIGSPRLPFFLFAYLHSNGRYHFHLLGRSLDGINLRNNYKGIIFAKYVVVRVIRELRDLRDIPKYPWYISISFKQWIHNFKIVFHHNFTNHDRRWIFLNLSLNGIIVFEEKVERKCVNNSWLED